MAYGSVGTALVDHDVLGHTMQNDDSLLDDSLLIAPRHREITLGNQQKIDGVNFKDRTATDSVDTDLSLTTSVVRTPED